MYKVAISLFLFLNIPISYGMECINNKESSIIMEQISSLTDNYGDVPNMADCKDKSPLNELVCSNSKLKDALLLLSMGSVYAYENATHTPVPNHLTYNNTYKAALNDLITKETDKAVALRKLCFTVKNDTLKYIGSLGVDESAYINVSNNDNLFFIQENNNGVLLQGKDINLYLGISCDAINTLGEKGVWYIDKNQFTVDINGMKYKFNYSDVISKMNCVYRK